MTDSGKKIYNQRRSGQDQGKAGQYHNTAEKRPRMEFVETSAIPGVPLLREGCSKEEFMIFERAWINHAQQTFKLEGLCFKLQKYAVEPMPTLETAQASFGHLLEVGEIRHLLVKMILNYQEKVDKRTNEKRSIFAALTSALSIRAQEMVEERYPAAINQQDPLNYWRAVTVIHKFGTYGMSSLGIANELATEYEKMAQRPGEPLAHYNLRFNTLVGAYRAITSNPNFEPEGPENYAHATAQATAQTATGSGAGMRTRGSGAAAIAATAPVAAVQRAQQYENPRLSEASVTYKYCFSLDPSSNAAFRNFVMAEEAKVTLGQLSTAPTTLQAAIALAENFAKGEANTAAAIRRRRGFSRPQQALIYDVDAEESSEGKGSKKRERDHDDEWLASRKCFQCGKYGHLKRDCPKVKFKKGKKEQSDRGASAEVAAANVREDAGAAGYGSEPEWEDIEIFNVDAIAESALGETVVSVSVNAVSAKGVAFLDSCATHHVVCDLELLTNVREGNKVFRVTGFTGQSVITKTVGDFGCFGEAILVPTGVKNIVSLGAISPGKSECRVDFKHGKAFVVTSPAGARFVFAINVEGLFQCSLGKEGVDVLAVAPVTVEGRKVQFSNAERARAEKARKAERTLGFASPGDVAYAINNGAITNADFTVRDIQNAEYIFGSSLGRVMGKSTRPSQVKNLLPENGEKSSQREQELHCDPFYVEGVWFLLSVVAPMGQWLCSELPEKRTTVAYRAAVEKHVGICKSHGFTVTRVIVDQEAGLNALVGQIPDVTVHVVSTAQHVQRVERAIRTLKERARAIISSLPFRVPSRCVRHLVAFVVQRVNAVPRRSLGPVSTGELFTGRKFDMKVDGKAAFGDYVVAPEPENDNTMRPRARLCIVMHPSGHATPSWVLFDVERGTFVSRTGWRAEPIPQQAIDRMNMFADADEVVRNQRAGMVMPEAPERRAVLPEAGAHELQPLELVQGRAPEPEFQPEAIAIEEEAEAPAVEPIFPVLPQEARPGVIADDAGAPECIVSVLDARQCVQSAYDAGLTPAKIIGTQRVAVNTMVRKFLEEKKSHTCRVSTVEVIALHMYAQEAKKRHGDRAVESAEAELREILERGVLSPLTVAQVRILRKAKKKFIKSFLFFKEKLDRKGELAKLKARLVAMDNSYESSLHPDKDSPTVRLESVFAVLAIAAAEGRRCIGLDVGNAYLEADMTGEEVVVEIDSWVARRLVRLRPELQTYVGEDGKLYARLDKALYGCVQSAKLWYKHLRGVLERLGFVVNPYDECVFNLTRNGKQITMCCYVDDLLCTCVDAAELSWLVSALQSEFKKVTVNDGDEIEFVALEISQRGGVIDVGMTKYINSLLEEWGGNRTCATPAEPDIFTNDDGAVPLDEAGRAMFHRRVARLLFFAKRLGVDILLVISVLAGRVKAPTVEDLDRLERVYRYLLGSRNRKLRFRRGKVSLEAFIDASFAVMPDFKSRTGLLLFINGSVIGAWASKQDLNTRSSTEAELVALTDMIGWVVWMRNWLIAQGYPMGPAVVYQDNTSVKDILKRGPSSQLRTRHLSIRYHFAGDLMKREEIVIVDCRSEDMWADGLTKILVGSGFRRHRSTFYVIVSV